MKDVLWLVDRSRRGGHLTEQASKIFTNMRIRVKSKDIFVPEYMNMDIMWVHNIHIYPHYTIVFIFINILSVGRRDSCWEWYEIDIKFCGCIVGIFGLLKLHKCVGMEWKLLTSTLIFLFTWHDIKVQNCFIFFLRVNLWGFVIKLTAHLLHFSYHYRAIYRIIIIIISYPSCGPCCAGEQTTSCF